jgi:hypothetical protein
MQINGKEKAKGLNLEIVEQNTFAILQILGPFLKCVGGQYKIIGYVCMYVCSKKKKEQLPYVNLNYRM